MNNEQPRPDDVIPRTSARPTGPTLEGFRRHLLDAADRSGVIQAGILEAVVGLLDDYTNAHPGTPVPGRDTLSRRNLHSVASTYRSTQRHPDGDLDGLLDDYAAEFSLADIRILRVAGEAVAAATPRAIKAARDRGMKPPQIADELGLTPSRVYQVLREHDAKDGKKPAADGDQ
ncbi:helix-turn-helix domain-containing protein [Streptomyces hygroscopicus]|uniref:helix-turn-helix domain-containing protein n=1 Tax=Streptomyces hygroscopicus TaxID=1912 RepID=UPI0036AE1796